MRALAILPDGTEHTIDVDERAVSVELCVPLDGGRPLDLTDATFDGDVLTAPVHLESFRVKVWDPEAACWRRITLFAPASFNPYALDPARAAELGHRALCALRSR